MSKVLDSGNTTTAVTADSPDSVTENHDQNTVSPPWLVFPVVLAAVITALALYGWSVFSLPLIMLEILIGAASIGAGGFLGFLFGIPRTTVDISGKPENNPGESMAYTPNNNLEQIADWLTKILIGVGLVELKQIGSLLAATGRVVAGSFEQAPTGTDVVTQIIIITFLILGFLASFLWTRIYYVQLQTMTDFNLLNVLRGQLQKVETKLSDQAVTTEQVKKELSDQAVTTEQVKSLTDKMASGTLVTQALPPETEGPALDKATSETAWPEDVESKFDNFRKAPVVYNSDPAADNFPGAPQEANGRKLVGVIEENMGKGLSIVLKLIRTGGEPLTDEVVFLLHPTLRRSFVRKQPKNDQAEVNFYASGWFTAVAILDHGKTVLSYDLKNLPDAPDWFKNN